MTRVGVVGGGIAGLAAAYDLAVRGLEVVLVERSGRIGGKLCTGELAGVAVEEGADAFLLRQPAAADLASGLGLELVHPAAGPAQVFAGGRLRTLPPGTVLGVPGGLAGLPGVLSPLGLARAALDLVLPADPVPADPAVGELVRRRLGREVLDRMVDPLLGGVYAGRAEELSAAVTAPPLVLPGRSLMRTVARRRPLPSGGPVFGSVVGGLGGFATGLSAAFAERGGILDTDCTATGLARSGAQWALRVRTGRAERTETFDAVVLAVPAGPAAKLLAAVLPSAVLPDTRYASVALVTLAYQPGTAVPPGNGFLVAASERRTVKAVTFMGAKWGHPAGAPVIVRASVGRFGAERDLQRPDTELAGVVAAEVAALAGVAGRPLATAVRRWGGALPQYRPGHLGRLAALRAALPPGLVVAGAGYDGVGIPACVCSGETAARAVAEVLGG